MASVVEDFFPDADLDELFSLLDDGVLENQGFESEQIVKEIADARDSVTFSCKNCLKTYKTERGLARHIEAKHEAVAAVIALKREEEKHQLIANKLHPLHVKSIVICCAKKLHNDMCYPEDIRSMFSPDSFSFSNSDAQGLWAKIKPIIFSFNGDAEKLHTQFFGLLVDNLLPSKFDDCSTANILLIEVAIGIVNHLNKTVFNLASSTSTSKVILSEKEVSIVYTVLVWVCCQEAVPPIHQSGKH